VAYLEVGRELLAGVGDSENLWTTMTEHRDGSVIDTYVSRERDEEAERERMRRFLTESLKWEREPGGKSGVAKWREAVERFTSPE
jgi:hypothetical protein